MVAGSCCETNFKRLSHTGLGQRTLQHPQVVREESTGTFDHKEVIQPCLENLHVIAFLCYISVHTILRYTRYTCVFPVYSALET